MCRLLQVFVHHGYVNVRALTIWAIIVVGLFCYGFLVFLVCISSHGFSCRLQCCRWWCGNVSGLTHACLFLPFRLVCIVPMFFLFVFVTVMPMMPAVLLLVVFISLLFFIIRVLWCRLQQVARMFDCVLMFCYCVVGSCCPLIDFGIEWRLLPLFPFTNCLVAADFIVLIGGFNFVVVADVGLIYHIPRVLPRCCGVAVFMPVVRVFIVGLSSSFSISAGYFLHVLILPFNGFVAEYAARLSAQY